MTAARDPPVTTAAGPQEPASLPELRAGDRDVASSRESISPTTPAGST